MRSPVHEAPVHVSVFIEKALPTARQVKLKWGVPVAVLIAQSAQETGWGLHVVNNAYFGIKGIAPGGGSVECGTTEVVKGRTVHISGAFRAYTCFEESADDYGRFLSQNPRYQPAFVHKDEPEKFVQQMALAGYATDPHYAPTLIGIIHAHGLAEYDRE